MWFTKANTEFSTNVSPGIIIVVFSSIVSLGSSFEMLVYAADSCALVMSWLTLCLIMGNGVVAGPICGFGDGCIGEICWLVDLVGEAVDAGDALVGEERRVCLVGVVCSVDLVWLVGNAVLMKPPISRPWGIRASSFTPGRRGPLVWLNGSASNDINLPSDGVVVIFVSAFVDITDCRRHSSYTSTSYKIQCTTVPIKDPSNTLNPNKSIVSP